MAIKKLKMEAESKAKVSSKEYPIQMKVWSGSVVGVVVECWCGYLQKKSKNI